MQTVDETAIQSELNNEHSRKKLSSSSKACCNFISQKWVFTILASAGLCIQNLFNVIMSITIIEMVVPIDSLQNQDNDSCPSYSEATTLANESFSISQKQDNASIERYSWDEYTQGIILSSFSWSSTIAQFFYGTVAERFGGKHLLGFAILAQAVLTFATPYVVHWGASTALIVIRVIMGLATDGLFPVVSRMIPHWSTPADRTTIGNAIYSGPILGLFFGYITPALIMKYSGMGWPAVFYFFGIVGTVWFTLWSIFVYENPTKHPFITKKELEYLQSSSTLKTEMKSKLPPPPWKNILWSKENWAFIIANTGCNCAYYVMLSGLPRYMGNVVKFPIESNGYFSSLPYVFMWLNSMLSVWINEKILEKQWVSLTNMRKLLTTVSVTGPGIFLLLASYAECNKTMVVISFIIGITMIGSVYSSLMMNPLDLSPNYAGSLMSIGTGIPSSASILAPYLIGVLVPNSTLSEWRVVFWIVLSFASCSNAIYLLWFKAEIQPWNEPDFERNKAKCVVVKEEVELKLIT